MNLYSQFAAFKKNNPNVWFFVDFHIKDRCLVPKHTHGVSPYELKYTVLYKGDKVLAEYDGSMGWYLLDDEAAKPPANWEAGEDFSLLLREDDSSWVVNRFQLVNSNPVTEWVLNYPTAAPATSIFMEELLHLWNSLTVGT